MSGTGEDAAAGAGCGCAAKAAAEKAKGACCGGHGGHAGHDHHHHAAPKTGVLDPVCGMTVDPATSKHRFDHEGTTYHFCSAG